MKTLCFATLVRAPRQAVWDAMLGAETYRVWTAEFVEGSYFEGSWNKGERIRFLGPDGSGMTSAIEENWPHEFISIRHLGYVRGGVEDTDSDEVRAWAPAFEKYSLTDAGPYTKVSIALDVAPDWEEYMLSAWPKALARLKAVCEARPV